MFKVYKRESNLIIIFYVICKNGIKSLLPILPSPHEKNFNQEEKTVANIEVFTFWKKGEKAQAESRKQRNKQKD